MRPNRYQSTVCRHILSAELGAARAEALLLETGADVPPALLPSSPRDLDALSAELQPFVDVYRALQRLLPQDRALALIRECVIESGKVSHSAEATAPDSAQQNAPPLNLTSPPEPGFALPADELERRFQTAMRFFSCEGELDHYTPQSVRFFVTQCNWCEAMKRAGTPELIPIFCETDERFMDDHPTHRLVRPTAIGLGDSRCDFKFVPRQ